METIERVREALGVVAAENAEHLATMAAWPVERWQEILRSVAGELADMWSEENFDPTDGMTRGQYFEQHMAYRLVTS